MTKTITFQGKKITIAFNMAAQLAFEQVANKPFDLTAIGESTEQKIALYFACIIAGNKDTDITIDTLLNDADFNDIRTLDTAIGELLQEFYHIPATVAKDEPSSASSDDEEEAPNH